MNSLAMIYGVVELNLHGPLAAAPFKGARRKACSQPGADGSLGETLVLYLEGRPSELADALEQIRRLLEAARQGGDLCMTLTEFSGGPIWQTRLLGGSLCVPANAGALQDGALQAELEVRRMPDWLGPELELALNGLLGGAALGSPGRAWIDPLDPGGSQPGAVRLEIANLSASEGLGTVRASLTACKAATDPDGLLEAEVGSGGTLQTSAACSGGQFRRCSMPASEGSLLTWDLPVGLVGMLAGREVCALVRLANAAAAGLWLGWEVRSTAGSLLAGSARVLLTAGGLLHELPGLRMPAATCPLSLRLVGLASGSGSVLDVDYVQLLPLEGARSGSLPAASTLLDDGQNGSALLRFSAGDLPVMVRGAGLRLRPDSGHRLTLLHDGSLGTQVQVRAWARGRREQ